MNMPILHPPLENRQFARRLDAMAIERSLWIAQWTAERAGFLDLAADILDVLIKAVERRCEIEASA
jgi:hypothetical protein